MALLTLIIFYQLFSAFVSSQCIISIQDDLSENQPLLLKPGTWRPYGNNPYYLPGNHHGEIMFDSNQEIVLHCPGSGIQAGSDVHEEGILHITCTMLKDFTVIETRKVLPFRSFVCVRPPQHIVRRTGQKCTRNKDLLEIGFNLNNGIFLTQISVCFDLDRKETLYTKFYLTPSIDAHQYGVPRRFFEEGRRSFFNFEVEQCYKIPRQRVNINRQLHLAENSYEVIDRFDNVFTRGHLCAKGDFVFGHQQSATFYFVNCAPQWKSLNNDNWNELEKSIRSFASHKRREFLIYTGTYGIARVNNIELFLYRGEVIGQIPIPLYFWKVVYDPEDESGVAFISINNPFDPHVNIFCRNICSQIDWQITWERENRQLGYSFCCEVNDFRRVIEFPQFRVQSLLNG